MPVTTYNIPQNRSTCGATFFEIWHTLNIKSAKVFFGFSNGESIFIVPTQLVLNYFISAYPFGFYCLSLRNSNVFFFVVILVSITFGGPVVAIINTISTYDL